LPKGERGPVIMVRGIEDLRALVGQELGTTAWHEVRPSQMRAFERAIGASDDASSTAPLFVLGLGRRFLYELLVVEPVRLFLDYGYDHVRFGSVRPAGGHLRMRATLAAVRECSGTAILTLSETFEVRGAQEPVCVADRLVWIEWVPAHSPVHLAR
jgi:hypothetical protein